MMPAEGMGEATVGDKINLVIDLDRCWGCKACEVACKQELELGAGPRPMLVEAIGPRKIEDQLHWDFVPVFCQHCHQPACRDACPTGAIFMASDGTVQIDPDLCDRCGACESACPYGAIAHTDQHGPVKCTLCFSRREHGGMPSCAQHCIGRAFTVASEQELSHVTEDKKYVWRTGQVIYTSDKWAGLGQSV